LVVSPPSANTSNPVPPSDYVKKPAAPASLASLVLRDLKLSRTYGAAIDQNGDVLQWGRQFSETGAVERTLVGKDLVSLETTEEGKLFGLDKKGGVWVWSSSKLDQRVGGVVREEQGQLQQVSGDNNSWWWLGQGTIWGGGARGDAIECLQLKTDVALQKGEKSVPVSLSRFALCS